MIKITVTSSLHQNKEFYFKGDTEQDCLNEANSKYKLLGKRDWWLQKSVDEEGNDVFPPNTIEPHESRVRTIDVPEYTDEEGNVHPAYSYDVTEYKQQDQWSYTVEDISSELALEEVMKARREAYNAAGLDMNKFVEYLTENNTEKIAEYRTLKSQIKAQHPKP